MKGTLYIQRDKGVRIEKPEPVECEIDMRKDGMTIAGVGHSVKGMLHKSQVEHISANGLRISGVKEHGFGLVHYQEWWFIPIIQESP
jgi:hypothetical protein